jgi:hypothetical protein
MKSRDKSENILILSSGMFRGVFFEGLKRIIAEMPKDCLAKNTN